MITDHLVVLALIVVTIGACLTALTPFSGARGFLKNLTIYTAGLTVLTFLGALLGRTLRDFLTGN